MYSFFKPGLAVCFVSMLACTAIQAVSPYISLFERDGKKIIFVHSWHIDSCQRKGAKQQDDLIRFAKQHNAYVIAEDMVYYEGSRPEMQKWLVARQKSYLEKDASENENKLLEMITGKPTIDRKDFLLSRLLQQAREQGLQFYNAECRQPASASEIGYKVSGKEIAQDLRSQFEQASANLEILNKNSNREAQLLYQAGQKLLMDVQKNAESYLQILQNCPYTIKQLEEQGINFSYKGFFDLFDRELIDLRILLNIYKNKDKRTIIVIAGGCHCARVEALISTYMHYNKIYSLGNEHYLKMRDQEVIEQAVDIAQFFHDIEHLQSCPECPAGFKTTKELDEHERLCPGRHRKSSGSPALPAPERKAQVSPNDLSTQIDIINMQLDQLRQQLVPLSHELAHLNRSIYTIRKQERDRKRSMILLNKECKELNSEIQKNQSEEVDILEQLFALLGQRKDSNNIIDQVHKKLTEGKKTQENVQAHVMRAFDLLNERKKMKANQERLENKLSDVKRKDNEYKSRLKRATEKLMALQENGKKNSNLNKFQNRHALIEREKNRIILLMKDSSEQLYSAVIQEEEIRRKERLRILFGQVI